MIRWVGFWLAFIGLSAGSLILLWGTDVPLGISGEWVWARIRVTDLTDVLLGWTQAAVGGGAYLVFVWIAVRRLDGCSRPEAVGWLGGLVLIAFWWLCILQESPQVDYRSSKVAWVLYFPSSSGYFQHARQHLLDVDTFLRGYQQFVAEGDVLHFGTHPPGLFLFHRGLIDLCGWSPGLTAFLLQFQPQSLQDGFSAIAVASRMTDVPLLAEDRAAIWLAALITQFTAVATTIPLYLLLRRDYSRTTSWMAVAFWPAIPAVAMFLPKSDALYPCFAVGFLYLWLEGCTRPSVWRCMLAGLVLWLGMLLSLALLPIVVLAGLLTVWEIGLCGGQESYDCTLKRCIVAIIWALLPFVLFTVLLWLRYDLNLFVVWRLNYQNHAGFYHQYPRTYWKWLLVNPIELTMAAGVPIVVLAVASFRGLRSRASSMSKHLASPFYCSILAWGLLWLSGKNSGEAARLWIVLLPCFVWLIAPYWDTPESEFEKDSIRSRWLLLLSLQCVVCIATMTRVDGFHLDRYLQ